MNLVELFQKLEVIYLSAGLPVVFFGSIIEGSPVSFVVPVGIFVVFGGFFAYGTPLSLVAVLFAGWLGTWSAYLIAYLIGSRKSQGRMLIKLFKQEEQYKRAKVLLHKHGVLILSASLLAAFTRFWISYVAGAEEYNKKKFIFYSGLGSLAWTSFTVMIGYLAAVKRSIIESGVAKLGFLGIPIFIALVVFLFVKFKKSMGKFEPDETSIL